jgi:signal transduction histidine kinase
MTARRLEARASAWEEIQSVIDGLDEQAAFLSKDGIILAVNSHWRREVERQARHGLLISRDYDAFLAGIVAEGDEGARPILEAFRDIRAGNRNSFSCLYRGAGGFDGYDFKVVITAMHVHDELYVLITVHDVTELVSLKRQRRRLGSQLLHAQDAERRRLARDLHDSTAQALVALQLSLHRLTGIATGIGAQDVVAECQEAIQEVHREIRALSFIAHPPSPAILGLQIALENLATGFAKRVGFEIHVECSDVGEASASIEAAIFRLTQEALANIHRHACATHAIVRLVGREDHLHLLIADDGVGFDWAPGKTVQPIGVGVLGMTERVHELGGRLSVMRRDKGTLLRASLPRQKADIAET